MKRKNKVIFVAEQIGGLDALLPVIKIIQKNKNFESILLLDNKNICNFAKEKNIKFFYLESPTFKKIEVIIKKINPDIIFTDTNNKEFDRSIDKRIIKIAKNINKPTVSIVDSWMNYKERFGRNLEYLPDYILAIDEEMKNDLGRIGIPEHMIKITGNPRFDKLSKIKKIKGEKNLIVFYSEPFLSGGLSEVDVFKDVVEDLGKNFPFKKIIVKFHPTREGNNDKYDNIIKNSKLSVQKAREGIEVDRLTKKSELVIGMRSMALFDAALMGKKVLSYQPEENGKDDKLRSNVYGWSVPIYKKNDLSRGIKNILRENVTIGKKQRGKYTQNHSTEKVINLIEGILKRKRNVCVIQSRMGSSRLPGKALIDLIGKPVLLRVVDRLLQAKRIDQIIVATTDKKEDEAIVHAVKSYNSKVEVFRGSELDVIDRYYRAVKKYSPDIVLRITADCPLIDPEVVDKVIEEFLDFKGDYVSNVLRKRTFPRGLDVEAFSFKILEKMWKDVKGKEDRENVTTFIRRNPKLFKCKNFTNPMDYSFHRWTLDEKDDYEFIKIIYQELYKKNPYFRMGDILGLLEKNPGLARINQHVEQKNKHY